MVNENDGKSWFANYVRDEVAMRRLFEAFVAGFLRHKMRGRVQVGSRRFSPYGLDVRAGSGSLIPSMRTDITVKSASKIVIIDTKYTPKIFQEHYGNRTIRSEHFYQIQAYTEHSCSHFPKHEVSAIVLYPRSDTDLDLNFAANGRAYTFRTIDLSQDWKQIEEDVFSLVKDRI
jgi:5-methylcytosine-specific restriction enzyme subunit McrC